MFRATRTPLPSRNWEQYLSQALVLTLSGTLLALALLVPLIGLTPIVAASAGLVMGSLTVRALLPPR